MKVELDGGEIQVPVRPSTFGDFLDLTGLIPSDCDVIMVMVNAGGGLNAGHPQPVGSVMLPHQLYVKDLERMLTRLKEQGGRRPIWITIAPMRSGSYVDVWAPKQKAVESKPETEEEGD